MPAPVTVIINGTHPSVEMKPPNMGLMFELAIKRFTERNANRDIVYSFDFDSEMNLTSAPSPFSADSSNLMWEYSTILNNNAVVNITVSILLPFTFN